MEPTLEPDDHGFKDPQLSCGRHAGLPWLSSKLDRVAISVVVVVVFVVDIY